MYVPRYGTKKLGRTYPFSQKIVSVTTKDQTFVKILKGDVHGVVFRTLNDMVSYWG